ncbi:hypothetical protein [Citrobacter freundii]|uniref:hypothetical protein n=1 Tax=Citrobacter freundii TaxID=546 RepID=UPI0017F2B7DE|nr:hypothetical protein [Citrobacter freundii]EEP7697476.1 hypothetical protein [Salmonella enterica]MEA8924291.1 hypothetical protein [Citrobacter freundii]MEA8929759.1 hypothetical protein [Citrobacter freundii]HAF3394490.1 hypothetical protein [Salmonella enterica]HAF6583270.1 hypothetical protein [Salmonella enterica]
MSDKKISDDDLYWLISNAPLLLKLKQEGAPLVSELISCRNRMWDEGANLDIHLLDHLMQLAVDNKAKLRSEYSAYPEIAKYLNAEILGGPGQPDLKTKEGYPVEVKTGSFSHSALRQLLRYMDSAGADFGFACAKTLSVKLPENISFIQLDYKNNCYVVVEDGGNENA